MINDLVYSDPRGVRVYEVANGYVVADNSGWLEGVYSDVSSAVFFAKPGMTIEEGAELLHSLKCRHNHTDYCPWVYEEQKLVSVSVRGSFSSTPIVEHRVDEKWNQPEHRKYLDAVTLLKRQGDKNA